jgi:hypothetical protein
MGSKNEAWIEVSSVNQPVFQPMRWILADGKKAGILVWLMQPKTKPLATFIRLKKNIFEA